MLDFRAFQPPGPIAQAFMLDRSRLSGIMGPVGSAKTSTSLMKIFMAAATQAPSPIDGVRYTKWAVVRDTYRNLQGTTLPSWLTWVPKDLGEFFAGPPAVHRLKFQMPDRTTVDCVVEFIALGDDRIEDVMRGWEGTGAYVNEADRLLEDVVTFLGSRAGRYPSKIHGGPSWRGVWCDFNAPDVDNWTYRRFVEKRTVDGKPTENEAFFRQPSGWSPRAENIANLPEGYYTEQAKGQPEWFVRRFIENEFGYSRDGKPVFAEFRDTVHVTATEIEPNPDWPLVIGADAGLTPGAVLAQQTPLGQWLILDELVAADMGAIRFGEALNRLLAERYRGLAKIAPWCDPAAAARASTDEKSWVEVMRAVTQLKFRPAPSNDLVLRLDAVNRPLSRLIDGKPGLLLSPRCRVLRKGFNTGYRFRRVQLTGQDRFEDKPEKNEFSHVMDGLQYALLGGGEYAEVTGRKARRDSARRAQAGGIAAGTSSAYDW
ncbi:hypothetical protein [Zavarzinia aquatilis]|uniref:TerL n=1 Tax=Zavarzinia aquatilis TaxID=2211142 RepID=A0A317EHR8_9PROT|nr:hypothetical protein [Zavarzinia aquatilis]PWR24973.1 hypothetical protein DKG74_04180 [Zavarzinia aquatilis]